MKKYEYGLACFLSFLFQDPAGCPNTSILFEKRKEKGKNKNRGWKKSRNLSSCIKYFYIYINDRQKDKLFIE